MATTADAITGQATVVSLKVGSAAYVDISGSTSIVDAPTSSKMIADVKSYGSTRNIFLAGDEEAIDITVNVIYTETSGEAFQTCAAAYAANDTVQLKWVLVASGNSYESSPGIIKSIVYPTGDPNSAGPLIAAIVIRTGGITRTAP